MVSALLIATAIAQDAVDPKPSTPLLAKARMAELTDLRQKCVAEWEKAVAKAKSTESGGAGADAPEEPDFGPLIAKAKTFAAQFASTDDGVQFLTFILDIAEGQAHRREALDSLLKDHLNSRELAQFGPNFEFIEDFVSPEYAKTALATLRKSTNAAVRGWAHLSDDRRVIEEADRDSEEYRTVKQALLQVAAAVDDKQLVAEIRLVINLRE